MTDGNKETIIESLTTSADFNGNVCIKILENIFDVNDISSIINCQKILDLILQNQIIVDKKPNKDPDKIEIPDHDQIEWVIEFEKMVKTQKVLLIKEDYYLLHKFSKDLKQIENNLSRINKLKKSFINKLNTSIEKKDNNMWTTLIEWLDKNIEPLLKSKPSINETEFMTHDFIKYTETTLAELKVQLDKEIKDFLHSKVNQEIILSNKEAANKWKKDLKDQIEEKNTLIQSIEKDIHTKLKDIVSPFDPPFIKTFYNELFTRCYKKLLTPEPIKDKNTTINEKTSFDINTFQVKKMNKIPTEIQTKLDEILLSFFDYMCNNETNINEYAKSKTKNLSSLIKNIELTEKQRKSIERLYHYLYKSSRHYEKNLNYLKEKLNEIDKSDTLSGIKEINKIIEQIYHEYKPLLMEYNKRIKNELTNNDINKRRKLIKEHDKQLIKIRNINKIIEISRIIDKIIHKKSDEISDTITNSKQIQNLLSKENWKEFYKVWKNQDPTILKWLESITKEIKINIDVQFRNARKPLKNQEITHPNFSSLINKKPQNMNNNEEEHIVNKQL